MKPTAFTNLLLLALIGHPAWAEDLRPVATDAATPALKVNSDATNHTRDLKNNQFHERGRDQHNRAEEIIRQNTTPQIANRIPPPGR